MRNPVLSWCVLLVAWLGIACAARPPRVRVWEEVKASRCAAPVEEHCVVLGCEEGVCGFFACEDVSESGAPATSSVDAPATGQVLALRPGFPMGPPRPGRWWRRAPWLRRGAEPEMTFR
ncbi:DUF2380 domain-containing protein [Myxococcus sp. AM009]|nr:DUF2380 domain-containing protein [Myxococcus sp. AM009]NVJ16415.1 DUF2380 domain-containing protein [Myxococcus sp. AM010]